MLQALRRYWAIILSVLWVIGSIGYLILCWPIEGLKPNEFGDFLAGGAAPLAFFWLVLGYFLQRQELTLQREELKLQREETARLANEANRQANLIAQNELHMRRDLMIRQLEFVVLKSSYAAAKVYESMRVAHPTMKDMWERQYVQGQSEVFEHFIIGLLENPGNQQTVAGWRADERVREAAQKYIDLLEPFFELARQPEYQFDRVINDLIQARVVAVLRQRIVN
jgi:hypothetical protein